MNNISAVILTAGESSRFYPFNDSHKSMVKVLGRPILEHTINGLKKEGIKKIILVIGKNEAIRDYFGDGKKFGISIDYVVQTKPLGMGNALLLAEKKIKGDFLLLSAHRIDAHKFVNSLLRNKLTFRAKAVLLVKQKENTQIHGVLKYEKNRVIAVIEKPKKGDEPSNLCVVGLYFFPYEFITTLKNTPSEHYQLEKAISAYAKENFVSFVETKDELVTLRYPWNLLEIKDSLIKDMKRFIDPKAKIAKTAEIIGEVVIEEGATIMEGVRIKGACYIGRNAVIGNNALLRNQVDVEENCVIGAYMEVKNSLIFRGATTHSGFIGDSIVGENCRIAAQFCTGNVRLDRKEVEAVVKGEKLDTGKTHLGAMIGKNTNIGIKSSTMPGVIIGKNAVIGPSTVVMKNIPDNTKYYTKFKEYISKKMNKKPVVLFDIDYTLFDTALFKKSYLTKHKIYEEVRDVLEELSKNAVLGIFSEGDLEFQRKKLNQTEIVGYFEKDNTHIVLNKLTEVRKVLQKYVDRKIFFVDDKLSILFDAKKIFPKVFTIWVKRGWYAENQKDIPTFEPDAAVENLSEVVKIVQKGVSS